MNTNEIPDQETNGSDASESYGVVICPTGGVEREHAELLKKRLIDDGFHDHVVFVRPTGADSTHHGGAIQ